MASVLRYLRVNEKKDGTINIVDTRSSSLHSFHPSGGMSAHWATEAQIEKSLGKSGGLSIKQGAGKYFIKVVFFPKAIGSTTAKTDVIADMLGLWSHI